MARMINWLPRVARRHREKGVAILLTLGVLSLTLVLVLSFAVTSTIDRRSAMNYADQVRARMLAESGLARAIGFLEEEMAGDLNSNDDFYSAVDGPWLGRTVTGSVNLDASSREGIDDALSVQLLGRNGSRIRDFTPKPSEDATLAASLGWVLIESVQDSSTDGSFSTQNTKVIGRLAYLIEDTSGHIDPGAWVEADPAYPTYEGNEPSRTATGNGSGFNVSDLNLTYAFDDAFIAGDQANMIKKLQSISSDGKMPNNGKWHSYSHIIWQNVSDYQHEAVFENLRPFRMPETSRHWWHDANDNNKIDFPDELRDKLDLTDANTSAVTIYNEMVGAAFQDGGTYSDITKFSPWLRSLDNLGGDYDAPMLRHIAARTALNIVDYNDTDNEPKGYYIDATTYELKPWSGSPADPPSYESLVHGSEAGWHIGAVLVELKIERLTSFTKLSVKAYLNMEVFYANGSVPIGSEFNTAGYTVAVTYEYRVTAGDIGTKKTIEYSGTFVKACTFLSSNYLSSGGEVYKDDTPKFMLYLNAPEAWPEGGIQVADDISIDYLRLNRVMLYKDGELADVVPEFASSSIIVDAPVLQTMTATVTGNKCYAGVWFRAKDPLCMKLYDGHPLQGTFIETAAPTLEDTPSSASLDDLYIGDGLPSADPATWNQSNQPFGGVEFADGFNDSQVYEIGRVKGYLPGRSLRLWSFSDNDASTHDGRLLDLFYAPNMPSIAGKVNINTQKDNVLFALFSDIAADANTAVTNAKALRGSNGFHSIGQLGGVHDLIDRVPTEDKSAETDYLPKIANLATVEQQFYNIIVTAQSVRDTTGIPAPDSINLGLAPTAGARTGEVLAEQQILAIVYRNVFTNEFEILRYEYLYD